MLLNKKAKYIFSSLMTLLLLLVMAQAVLAETGAEKAAGGLDITAEQGGIGGKGTETDLSAIIGGVVGTGLALIGVVFFCLILYAGFTWMTAMGQEEKINNAKEMIFAAVLGLIVVLGAYAVTNLVARIFSDTTGIK